MVTLLALLARGLGLVTLEEVTRPRPNTGFIWHPDQWSFVVALIAGAAGALALALSKTAILVGVFISVTTVPAAGNLALGLAFLGRRARSRGSARSWASTSWAWSVAGAVVLLLMRSSGRRSTARPSAPSGARPTSTTSSAAPGSGTRGG